LNRFTVYCAHRSGSNFLQTLITDNYFNCKAVENDRESVHWKHGRYHSGYNDGKKFSIVIARHPIKWVNSCMRFNADMWKWWDVNGTEEPYFTYKKKPVSIPKMINKWNNFYREWLQQSDCKFVWFADLLLEETREKVLQEIAFENNLVKNSGTIDVPEQVQHSKPFTEQKRQKEFDLSNNDMLNDKPHIIDFINDNIDKELLDLMMSMSYENCGSIQR